MPQATVTDIRTRRPRQTLATLCEPDREADEKLLRVIQGFEDRGRIIMFPGEGLEAEGGPRREVVGATPPEPRAYPGGQCSGAHSQAPSAPFVSPELAIYAASTRTEAQARSDRARAQLNRPRPVAHGVFAPILNWWRGA